VPLEHVKAGDEQAGTFSTNAHVFGHVGPHELDALAGVASVESVVGAGPVVLRTPLPHVRELVTSDTDDETLTNLPALERLSVGGAIDADALSAEAVAEGLLELICDRPTFGGIEPLARFGALERLSVNAWPEDSLEPLAGLTALRRLDLTASKGFQHLGALVALEDLRLTLEKGTLKDLRALAPLRALRRLEASGRALRSLEGADALPALETVVLRRTAVKDLAPLADAPTLRRVALDERFGAEQVEALRAARPDIEIDWAAPEAEPPGESVGGVRYRRLDTAQWAIRQDVTALLDVDDNLAAEARVAGALRDEDADLLARLTLDSDAEALMLVAESEADARRAAEVVAAMAAR
jgi:hypothetical protein